MNEMPQNINDFYVSLENVNSFDIWDLLKTLNPIENKIDDSWKDKIAIERKILAFSFNKGNLFPKITKTDVKGKLYSFPNEQTFNEIEIEYIIERYKQSNNSWIKSKYSHLLWFATKDNRYAQQAIDCYLDIIEIIKNDTKINSLSKIVEILLAITEKTKFKIEIIKKLVLKLIKSKDLKPYIIDSIVEIAFESKVFKANELIFSLPILKDLVNIEDNGNYFNNKTILNLAIKIAHNNNQTTNEYFELLAKNEDLIIEQHPNDNDFIKYIAYGEKAQYFKKAGNEIEYQANLLIYTNLKSKFELSHFETRLPEKEEELLNSYLNAKSDYLTQLPTDTILSYIASGDDMFIKNEFLDKMTDNNLKNSLTQLFSTSVFDINSNFKKLSDQDTYSHERFKNYTISFTVSVFPLFFKIVANGIINGKLNYHTVFNYFEKNTWFGQRFNLHNVKREIDPNDNWLSLIAPGLYDFFSQIECAFLMKENKIQNFILCIDSLTLKFEGALRDFIRLIGGTTTTEKKGELKEQILEELLQNPKTHENFTEEDLTMFKYVFTNVGWNIRNNVAHCFYPFYSYSFQHATLIFLCLLRLGKYKLNSTQNIDND